MHYHPKKLKFSYNTDFYRLLNGYSYPGSLDSQVNLSDSDSKNKNSEKSDHSEEQADI